MYDNDLQEENHYTKGQYPKEKMVNITNSKENTKSFTAKSNKNISLIIPGVDKEVDQFLHY